MKKLTWSKASLPLVILGWLAVVIFGPVLLIGFLWTPKTAAVLESMSPTGKGSVITTEVHNYDGPIVSLFVRDTVSNGGTPILLTSLPEGYDFESIIWSADGAVVALTMSNLLHSAYSFQSHKALRATGKSTTSGSMTMVFSPTPAETDAYLQTVLAAHGGTGHVVNGISRNELGWWKSRPYLP
jgi:hypothetical protein